jgi:hypothetical protein
MNDLNEANTLSNTLRHSEKCFSVFICVFATVVSYLIYTPVLGFNFSWLGIGAATLSICALFAATDVAAYVVHHFVGDARAKIRQLRMLHFFVLALLIVGTSTALVIWASANLFPAEALNTGFRDVAELEGAFQAGFGATCLTVLLRLTDYPCRFVRYYRLVKYGYGSKVE